MDTLLIVDGNAIIHRAYHALPAFKTKDGVPTNALYGFASMLHNTILEYRPNYVVVCFDTQAKTFRDEVFEDYRAHRPKTDDDLIKQFPMVREYLNAADIPYFELDGYEADDLIATLVDQFKKEKNLLSIILTGDKDIFQLANDRVLIATPQNGNKKPKLYDHDGVIKKFDLPPDKVADLKALTGDPSDNYKGVAGVGPKTAVKLIKEFGSVEDIYKHIDDVDNVKLRERLIKDKDNALLCKDLAVLKHDVPITAELEKLFFSSYNDSLKEFFDDYQFRSLKKRFFEDQVPETRVPEIKKEKKPVETKSQLNLF